MEPIPGDTDIIAPKSIDTETVGEQWPPPPASKVPGELKGFPSEAPSLDPGSIGQQGWSLTEGLVPPVALLRKSAIEHNLRVMAEYCQARGLELAPHGKTTMAPQLVALQVAHGAWGITAGTVHQARVFVENGVKRVLLAHQVVDKAGLAELAGLQRQRSEAEIIALVDSLAAVRLLAAHTMEHGSRRLGVLVELGVPKGRTGCRSVGDLLDVARAVSREPSLRLLGVEGYEGVIKKDSEAETLAAIDLFLDQLATAAHRLSDDGLAEQEVIVSAGGSAYFDRVAERFGGVSGITGVLRSGCYVVHDHGKYHKVSPLDGRSANGPRLQAALEVWASVVSVPEPGFAVLNAGRRDLGFDAGLPVGIKAWRNNSDGPESMSEHWEVRRLWDQHAVLHVPRGEMVSVGDLVGLGISHPCTTFDKWKLIPLVDDSYMVVDGVRTFF